MFNRIPQDDVIINKQNGTTLKNIKANIGDGIIYIANSTVPIEEGDIISRKLPSGIVENFKILDYNYFDKIGPVSAHFQIKVKKETSLLKQYSSQKITNITYNMKGQYSRINIDSEDHSIIISNKNAPIIFSKLKETIKNNIDSEDECNKLISKLDELETALDDKNKFLNKYQEFIALAANHMTLIGPFIPALSAFLGL